MFYYDWKNLLHTQGYHTKLFVKHKGKMLKNNYKGVHVVYVCIRSIHNE